MKTILLTILAAWCWVPLGWGYALEGPVGNGGDAWQVPADGFGPPRDTVAPKNIGEGYRRNVPVLYYGCDATFLDYFGTEGQVAVDKVFAVLNNVFTNNPTGATTGLDGYSTALSEFPLESQHINYQAQALGLFDLKSVTLGLMMGQLGLADPTMYVWNIHDWYHVGPVACPVGQEYLVVQRNYDYVSSPLNQLQYSAYINDVLYTYDILEFCTGVTPVRYADPFPVDLLANPYTPLASWFATLSWGNYYTGPTRDDVAGLRLLHRANTINWETVSADSLQYLITTNTTAPVVFPPYFGTGGNLVGGSGGFYTFTPTVNGGVGYGDLVYFMAFAKTNPPAVLLAAYPGLVISSFSVTETIVSNATIIIYYTNAPYGEPYGSPPLLVIKTNYNPVFEFLYNYQFANLITNHYTTAGSGQLVSVSVGTPIGAPYGSPGITNTVSRKVTVPEGDFFVLPQFYTNVCPLDILPAGSIPTVLAMTNGIEYAFTNSATTNMSSEVYVVTYFTNYSYVINPVTCATIAGATGLYEGIEKMQFVPANYDSLLGQFFEPITNNYTLKYVTNFQVQVQYFQRIVTRPDFLFAASDQVAGPNGVPLVGIETHGLNFDQANILPGLAGPGTITTPTTFTFEKAGPVYFNSTGDVLNGTPYFTEQPGSDITDLFYFAYFAWANYDGTTNAPVVFPNGTSIDNLENQILVQVSPTTLPAGANGVAYPTITFTANTTFFVPPFTWSATGLPAGLNLSPGGTLTGTPVESGTFVVNLTLTDSMSRTVQWYYSLTIQ